MKLITAIIIALGIAGCTSQDRTYAVYPTINCPPGVEGGAGNSISFEILVEAEAVSDTNATNQPDIPLELAIPLP